MSDLTYLQAGGNTKLSGSDSSGVEQEFIGSTNRELWIHDRLNNSGVYSNVAVTTSASELKAGGSALANRKAIWFMQVDGGTIYIGFDSSVTSSNGMPLFKNQPVILPCGPTTQIFAVASSGTINIRVLEFA